MPGGETVHHADAAGAAGAAGSGTGAGAGTGSGSGVAGGATSGRSPDAGRRRPLLARAIRAEAVRLAGRRGPWVRVILPLALVLPVAVTPGAAAAAEALARTGGLLRVRAATTDNAIYWVIHLGVAVHAMAAAHAQASADRGAPGELARALLPGPVSVPARWAVAGAAGAACSLVAVAVTLTLLPALFPGVYGGVSALSPAGLRFLWAVPVYCVAACGIGVGVGALVRPPAAAVAVVVLWSLLLEGALVHVPGGAEVISWMPFLNGVYGTGQVIALEPPWGPDGALAWTMLVAAALVAAGMARAARRG